MELYKLYAKETLWNVITVLMLSFLEDISLWTGLPNSLSPWGLTWILFVYRYFEFKLHKHVQEQQQKRDQKKKKERDVLNINVSFQWQGFLI